MTKEEQLEAIESAMKSLRFIGDRMAFLHGKSEAVQSLWATESRLAAVFVAMRKNTFPATQSEAVAWFRELEERTGSRKPRGLSKS
jgi:hypothetical protein